MINKNIEVTEPTKAQLIGEIMEVAVISESIKASIYFDNTVAVWVENEGYPHTELIYDHRDNITTEQLQQCLNKLKEL